VMPTRLDLSPNVAVVAVCKIVEAAARNLPISGFAAKAAALAGLLDTATMDASIEGVPRAGVAGLMSGCEGHLHHRSTVRIARHFGL
jgi:hypothetical protein